MKIKLKLEKSFNGFKAQYILSAGIPAVLVLTLCVTGCGKKPNDGNDAVQEPAVIETESAEMPAGGTEIPETELTVEPAETEQEAGPELDYALLEVYKTAFPLDKVLTEGADLLSAESYIDEMTWSLCDLSGDGMPELILQTDAMPWADSAGKVYSIQGGTLCDLGNIPPSMYSITSDGRLIAAVTHGGEASTVYSCGQTLETEAEFSEEFMGESDIEYTVNGSKVSEDVYMEVYEKYYNNVIPYEQVKTYGIEEAENFVSAEGEDFVNLVKEMITVLPNNQDEPQD